MTKKPHSMYYIQNVAPREIILIRFNQDRVRLEADLLGYDKAIFPCTSFLSAE